GEYHHDPAVLLPEGWSSGYRPRERSLTIAQAHALLDALPSHRAAHAAHMLAFGSRLGESERARRSDVDLAAGLVLVRGSKTARSWRTIPIPEHAADLAARALLGAAERGSAYRQWGNVRRDLAAAARRAGVPGATPNDLRRSAATWLIERGVPSHLVAYWLGRSEEHTSELQSRENLVCRLLLEKKNTTHVNRR